MPKVDGSIHDAMVCVEPALCELEHRNAGGPDKAVAQDLVHIWQQWHCSGRASAATADTRSGIPIQEIGSSDAMEQVAGDEAEYGEFLEIKNA